MASTIGTDFTLVRLLEAPSNAVAMPPLSSRPIESCKAIVALLVLISLTVTHSFQVMQQGRPHSEAASTFRQASLASSTESQLAEQLFHDYDKPILLIGASGPGNEMHRLAASFLSQSAASAGDGDAAIVTLDREVNLDELVQRIKDKTLQWPELLVLDLSHSCWDQEDGPNIHHDIARRLYENQLLTIYVNVDSESSNMPPAIAERKAQLDEALFLKCSDYEICIKDEGTSDDNEHWEHIEWEFQRILARARLVPAIPGDTFAHTSNSAHLTMGPHTFFLSLSFPSITQVEPFVQEMCLDVDAMEYRTDLLDCRDSRFDLLYGMQLLRRYCRPHCVRVPALSLGGIVLEDVMPIVYTVRTQNQAGTFPDDSAGIQRMFEMLHWGLRAGVEVLDVESAWDKDLTDSLLTRAKERYSSQILGSEHVVGRTISMEKAVELFQQCALDGRAHGAKVVLSIDNEDQDRMAHEAALIASSLAKNSGKPVIPNISLVLGDIGKFSRVVNLPFTPVTHESLPVKAAPGQMTSSEIMTARILTKIFLPKKYCILGHNIAYSVSPQMQGAAFAATKQPNDYIIADTDSVEEFIQSNLFRSDDFGGASVTIPHKQAIIPYVDVMSPAAREIGSVNTLIVKEEFAGDDGFKRVIYGDNTDWKGIFNPLRRLLGPVNSSADFALILGAGGTARAAAYVAKKLGMRCIYYNRTPSKAAELVDSFGGVIVESLEEVSKEKTITLGDVLKRESGSKLRVVISTLPASVGFVLPDWVLEPDNSLLPVVFDVNYKPFNTKLLLQAQQAGCTLVRGSEMLWEQGVGQFELWTERTAPYRVMKQVVLSNCIDS